MELFYNQIHYFMHIARENSLTESSVNLQISQSTLSKAITKLEKQLNNKVFIRNKSGVRLTPYGEKLYQFLLAEEKNWQQFLKNEQESSIQINGNFKIAAHQTFFMNGLYQSVASILEEYNDINIQCEFINSTQAVKAVIKGEVDFAICANPEMHPDLITKHVAKEFIGLFSNVKKISNIVYYNRETINSQKVISKLKNSKCVEINDYEIIAQLIKSSNHCGLLPSPVAKRHQLQFQHLSNVKHVEIFLIYRFDMPKNPSRELIIKKILNHYKTNN